jgi:hypothetical protein
MTTRHDGALLTAAMAAVPADRLCTPRAVRVMTIARNVRSVSDSSHASPPSHVSCHRSARDLRHTRRSADPLRANPDRRCDPPHRTDRRQVTNVPVRPRAGPGAERAPVRPDIRARPGLNPTGGSPSSTRTQIAMLRPAHPIHDPRCINRRNPIESHRTVRPRRPADLRSPRCPRASLRHLGRTSGSPVYRSRPPTSARFRTQPEKGVGPRHAAPTQHLLSRRKPPKATPGYPRARSTPWLEGRPHRHGR